MLSFPEPRLRRAFRFPHERGVVHAAQTGRVGVMGLEEVEALPVSFDLGLDRVIREGLGPPRGLVPANYLVELLPGDIVVRDGVEGGFERDGSLAPASGELAGDQTVVVLPDEHVGFGSLPNDHAR